MSSEGAYDVRIFPHSSSKVIGQRLNNKALYTLFHSTVQYVSLLYACRTNPSSYDGQALAQHDTVPSEEELAGSRLPSWALL